MTRPPRPAATSTYIAVSELTALLPTRTSPHAHKNNPPCISKLTPNRVSSSRPPHTCIVAFFPSIFHISAYYSYLAFLLPAPCISNQHTYSPKCPHSVPFPCSLTSHIVFNVSLSSPLLSALSALGLGRFFFSFRFWLFTPGLFSLSFAFLFFFRPSMWFRVPSLGYACSFVLA